MFLFLLIEYTYCLPQLYMFALYTFHLMIIFSTKYRHAIPHFLHVVFCNLHIHYFFFYYISKSTVALASKMASVSNYHIEHIAGLFVIHIFHTWCLLDNHVTLWNARQESGVNKQNTFVSHLNNKGRLSGLKRCRYSRLYNITIFKLLISVKWYTKVRMVSAFG